MSFSVGQQVNDGWTYSITVCGLTTTGWRCGSRDHVERYARESARLCADRAKGIGFQKKNARGKTVTDYLATKPRKKRKSRPMRATQEE